jgi:hypothetical protein
LAIGVLSATSGVGEPLRVAASSGAGERTASVVAIAVSATRPMPPPIKAAGREKTLCVAIGAFSVEFMVWLLPVHLYGY